MRGARGNDKTPKKTASHRTTMKQADESRLKPIHLTSI
jgi:hypothetical protein